MSLVLRAVGVLLWHVAAPIPVDRQGQPAAPHRREQVTASIAHVGRAA